MPSPSGSSKRNLYLVIGLIVLVIGGVITWLIASRSTQVAVSPTPIASATPTATPVVSPLEQAFGAPEMIVIPDNATSLQTLLTAINGKIIATGSLKTYKLVNETNQPYSFANFLSHILKISTPTNLSPIDSNTWVIGAYGQIDAVAMKNTLANIDKALADGTAGQPTPKNKIFIVAQIPDKTVFSNFAQAWENSAFQKEFAPLMSFTPPKVPATFKEDYYNGQPFRYLQASDRNSGIAYTTIDDFAIFGSSRDSFRAVIDALKH